MKKVFEKYSRKDEIMLIVFGVFATFAIWGSCCVCYIYKPCKILTRVFECVFYIAFFVDFFVDVFTKKRNISLLIWIVSIIAVLSFIPNFSRSFIVLVLFLIVLCKYDFEDVVKVSYYSIFFAYAMVILLCCLNVVPNLTYNRLPGDNSRNSLGFTYPTMLSSIFFYIMLMRCYLKKFKISYAELLANLLVICAIYYLTNSRTTFLLSLIIWVICCLMKINYLHKMNHDVFFQNNFVKTILVSIPVLFFLVWLGLTFMYAKGIGFVVKIDQLLSGRLYLSYKAFKEYPITLIGSKTKFQGWGGYGYFVNTENFEYNYLDNSYMNLLFINGVLPLILVIGIYMWIIKNAISKKNYPLLLVLGVVMIDTMIDTFMVGLIPNVFVLAGSPLFQSKMETKDENDKIIQEIKK